MSAPRLGFLLFCTGLAAAPFQMADASADEGARPARVSSAPGTPAAPVASHAIPVWFEPTAPGEAGSFVARGPTFTMSLSPDGARIDMGGGRMPGAESAAGARQPGSRQTLSIEFIAAHPRAGVSGAESRPGVSHYFLGSDPAAWRRDVPQFGAVRMTQVYPGIDVLFYARQTTLEYDLVVAPGSDPRDIALRMRGASSLELDDDGHLLARLGQAAVKQRHPIAYQDLDGVRRAVDVAFRVDGDRVSFDLGEYDRSRPLVIDPVVVVFGSLIGGSDVEFIEGPSGTVTSGIAADAQGNLFIAGDTASTSVVSGFPGATLFTPNLFVVKIDPDGSQVLFASYIGGSGLELRGSLALDASGNVFVSGLTTSTDFPITPGAVKTVLASGDAGESFLVRLTPQGIVDYGTYLGGTDTDSAEAVTARGSRAVVVGSTNSADIPISANAAQPALGGDFDGWVAVVESVGDACTGLRQLHRRQRAGCGLLGGLRFDVAHRRGGPDPVGELPHHAQRAAEHAERGRRCLRRTLRGQRRPRLQHVFRRIRGRPSRERQGWRGRRGIGSTSSG